jgi:transcriptional regulator with XRE-family HTH domain
MARAKKTTELPLKKAFGRRLRDIRERRDLSQKQLADLLSTDVMQISRYERGIGLPSLETCVQLAAILKVSTDELLLGEEPRGAALEISDVRLLDKFQRLQRLNKRDREAVIILIDGVLASRAVESAIASAR